MARSDEVQRWAGEPGQRINWRWQWRLRRWGRADGRLREPDPLAIPSPVRTSVRMLLEAELQVSVEQTGLAYGELLDRDQNRLRALDMRIAQLQDELDSIERRLDQIDTGRPDADTPPERRQGDRDKSESVVRARRRREFERRHAGVRKLQEETAGELRTCREEWARLVAQIDANERRMIDEAHRQRAAFMHVESIYLRALLKRHPEGDLLRMMLDESPYRLPGWADRDDRDAPSIRSAG